MKIPKSALHLSALLFALSASPVFAADAYPSKTQQKFIICAKKGFFALESVLPEHSVNDQGKVAFLGSLTESGTGLVINHLFVSDITEKQASGAITSNLTPGISSIFARSLGPQVSLNNSGIILTRRVTVDSTPFGPLTFSYLDSWNSTTSVRVNLQTAHPPTGSIIDTQFHGFYGPSAHNNLSSSSYAFTAIINPTSYIAMVAGTSAFAPFNAGTPIPAALMVSDDNKALMRLGNQSGGSISRLAMPGVFPIETLASPAQGFGEVGARPGASDDGKLTVFTGNLNASAGITANLKPGWGVFVHRAATPGNSMLGIPARPAAIIRVAGVHGDGHLAPGEFWDDNSAGGTRDGIFNDPGDQDIGPITAFEPEDQVCVNNQGSIAFLARNSTGQKVIFSATFDATVDVVRMDPFPVISGGDPILGLGGTVTDLALSDSLGNRGIPGDLAFWARMSDGDTAIVSTRPTPRPVIFIPGIAASELADGLDTLWPPTSVGRGSDDDVDALSLEPGLERPNVRAVDVIRTAWSGILSSLPVYQPLLDKMREEGFLEILPQITVGGTYSLPPAAVTQGSNFFLFPYDWRQSSGLTSQRLAQFIAEIRKMYPTSDVDLICHSLGGLVARRYIIDHPTDHHVNRCVTIGSPFLGTPAAYQRILAGGFFGPTVKYPYLGYPIDHTINEAIKRVLPRFPGFHELFPSDRFFPRRTIAPLVERGWDLNNNDWAYDEFTEQAPIKALFDLAYTTHPVSSGQSFHTSLQDDWSGTGSFGVEYLQFVGVREAQDTVVQAIAWEEPVFAFTPIGPIEVSVLRDVQSLGGRGDGTVDFVSAYRSSDLWGAGPPPVIVQGTAGTSAVSELQDDYTEHTTLTQNARVHRGLLYFLRSGRRLWTDPTPISRPLVNRTRRGPPEPSVLRELSCIGTQTLLVRNPEGLESVLQPDSTYLNPRDTAFFPGGISVRIRYGVSGPYTFTIPTLGEPIRMALEITARDSNNNINAAIRFHDVTMPAGANARLVDTGFPPYMLEIDDDGNGSFERAIPAGFVVSGVTASDTLPPNVTAQIIRSGAQYFMQLSAVDTESGVSSIHFQQNNSPAAQYTGIFSLNALRDHEVVAFSTDNAGNRSGLARFAILPRPRVSRQGGLIRLQWRKTAWPISVETSPDLSSGDSWKTVVAAQIDLGTDFGVDIDAAGGRGFYRLRLAIP